MPRNTTKIPATIKDHPLPTWSLSILPLPDHRLAPKSSAGPERILVQGLLTTMHINRRIVVIPKPLRIVVDLISVQFARVVDSTPDIGVEIDLGVLLRVTTEDDLRNWEESTLGELF